MKIGMVVVVGVVAWQSSVGRAGSFEVSNINDDGAGSLRAAIVGANAAPGSHTIHITATGTINLVNKLETLSATTAITGPGADKLRIERTVASLTTIAIHGAVQLSGVTVVGFLNSTIVVEVGGSLVLRDCAITGNATAMRGAAIFASGPLTIERCKITGNSATGAQSSAIYAGAAAMIVDSTIADNQGTAIVFDPGAETTLMIDRSTVSGNGGGGGIGAIELRVGTAAISNSTFSNNTGGDFWTFSDGVTLSLTNVTSVGNGAPALLFDHPAGTTVTLLNTVFAGSGARCVGTSHPTSRGHNLASDASCSLGDSTDRMTTDPRLGPLAANGGTTRTHAPLAGSPAVNTGAAVALEAVDQRGFPRVQFAAADIGAVEVTEPLIAQQPMPQKVATGAAITLSVTAHDPSAAAPLRFQWRKGGEILPGATSGSYTKADAQLEDSGAYDVLVSNDGGSIASMPALVIVGDSESGGCASTAASGGGLAGVGLALLALRRRPRAG